MRRLIAWLGWALILTLTGCATTNTVEPPSINSAQSQPAAQAPQNQAAPSDLRPLRQDIVQSEAVARVELPRDIWERIRRGFAMPDLESSLVDDRVQWYTQRPDYILRMTERSRRYMHHIVEEIEARGMPTELALLPFVESAFNPQAVSSAKATGMWQFMPATGRDFDLKQNAFRDDRRDIQASTRAALDYLQRLYALFGDWHLALASYNWGEGSVGRAIARNQKMGLATGYTDLSMPMETRFYVPKLQALKNIIARPNQFGVRLPDIPNHPFFQSVPLPRDMDVSVAAKLAEVSLDDFKSLNPSAHRPVLLAAGTPQILLPWDNAEIFQRNYEAFGGARLASWTAWVAPTNLKVADAAKRVGMPEAEFRALNQIPPRMLIKAGSVLLVPRAAQRDDDVAPSVADHGQIKLAAESVPKNPPKSKAKKSVSQGGTQTTQTTKSTPKAPSAQLAKTGAKPAAQTPAKVASK